MGHYCNALKLKVTEGAGRFKVSASIPAATGAHGHGPLELQIPLLVESGGLGLQGLGLEAVEDAEEGGQGVLAFNRLGLVHRDTLELYQPAPLQPEPQQEAQEDVAGAEVRDGAAAAGVAVKQEIKEEVDEVGRRVGESPVKAAAAGGDGIGGAAAGAPPAADDEVIELLDSDEDEPAAAGKGKPEVVELLESDEPEQGAAMDLDQTGPAGAAAAGAAAGAAALDNGGAAAAGQAVAAGAAAAAGGSGAGGATSAGAEAAAGAAAAAGGNGAGDGGDAGAEAAAAGPPQLDAAFTHDQLAVGYAASVKEGTKVCLKFNLQDDHHNFLDHLKGKLQILEHKGWRKQRQQQAPAAGALDPAAAAEGMDVDEVVVLGEVVVQGGHATVEWEVQRGDDWMGEHLLEVKPVTADLHNALPVLLVVTVSEGNYPTQVELATPLPQPQQRQQQELLVQLDNNSDKGPALPGMQFVLHTRDGAVMPLPKVRSLMLRVLGEGGAGMAGRAQTAAAGTPMRSASAGRGGVGTPRKGARAASSTISGGRTIGRARAAAAAALAEVPGCIVAQPLAPNVQAGRILYELAAGEIFLPTQPGVYQVVVYYGEGKALDSSSCGFSMSLG